MTDAEWTNQVRQEKDPYKLLTIAAETMSYVCDGYYWHGYVEEFVQYLQEVVEENARQQTSDS